MGIKTGGIKFKSIQNEDKILEKKLPKVMRRKVCHADEDQMSHNECAMMPNCKVCPSYR